MSKCWDGKYAFEKGEEVEVKRGYPFAKRRGIVNSAMSTEQFGILLCGDWRHRGQEVVLFADALKLEPIALARRKAAEERRSHADHSQVS